MEGRRRKVSLYLFVFNTTKWREERRINIPR
jgi:hypothetical protein